MFFLPLLLVCSISADQPETPLQPPCPQDIHAVLREMTASLTEQKVEIRTLKEHNKGKILPLGNYRSTSITACSSTDGLPDTTSKIFASPPGTQNLCVSKVNHYVTGH